MRDDERDSRGLLVALLVGVVAVLLIGGGVLGWQIVRMRIVQERQERQRVELIHAQTMREHFERLEADEEVRERAERLEN